MLVKDLRYVRVESVKEKGIGYTRLSVKKKKRIKKHTDRAKYLNLPRVPAQSVLSVIRSVNRANANGMKFSGISTASVNITQSRTVKQSLRAA